MAGEKPPKKVISVEPTTAENWRKQKTEESLNARDPEREKTYPITEENDIEDPILLDLIQSLEGASEEETKTQINAFIKAYPEKAQAYRHSFGEIQDAVRTQEAKQAATVKQLHTPTIKRIRNNDPRDPNTSKKGPAEEWKEMKARGNIPPDSENTKIYRDEIEHLDPDSDPVVKKARRPRLSTAVDGKSVAVEPHNEVSSLVKAYPEKAAAYSEIDGDIQNEVISQRHKQYDINEDTHDVSATKTNETIEKHRKGDEERQKIEETKARLREHAEAMHATAQEESGIQNPESLKNHLESVESQQKKFEADKQKEAGKEKPKSPEAEKTAPENKSGKEENKKKWSEMDAKEKRATVAKNTLKTLGAAGGAWAALSIGGFAGGLLATELGFTGASLAATASGAGFFGGVLGAWGGFAVIDYIGWRLIKELWTTGGGYWGEEFFGWMGFKAGKGGGAPAPRRAPAAGGGGGGGGGGAHH